MDECEISWDKISNLSLEDNGKDIKDKKEKNTPKKIKDKKSFIGTFNLFEKRKVEMKKIIPIIVKYFKEKFIGNQMGIVKVVELFPEKPKHNFDQFGSHITLVHAS